MSHWVTEVAEWRGKIVQSTGEYPTDGISTQTNLTTLTVTEKGSGDWDRERSSLMG